MCLGTCLFSPLVKQNLGTDLACPIGANYQGTDSTSIDSYHDTVPITGASSVIVIFPFTDVSN